MLPDSARDPFGVGKTTGEVYTSLNQPPSGCAFSCSPFTIASTRPAPSAVAKANSKMNKTIPHLTIFFILSPSHNSIRNRCSCKKSVNLHVEQFGISALFSDATCGKM